MEVVEFRPRQRRTYMSWAVASAFVVLCAAIGIALTQYIRVAFPGVLLIILGGVGLILAPLTFNGAIATTVLSDQGIQTGGFVKRRARWSEVAAIETTRVQARSAHGTRLRIALKSGKSFMLSAPFDVPDGEDPEFVSKVGRIQAYWYAHRDRAR